MTIETIDSREPPRFAEVLRRAWDGIRPGTRDVAALKRLHRELQLCLVNQGEDAALAGPIKEVQNRVRGMLLEPGPISVVSHEEVAKLLADLREESQDESRPELAAAAPPQEIAPPVSPPPAEAPMPETRRPEPAFPDPRAPTVQILESGPAMDSLEPPAPAREPPVPPEPAPPAPSAGTAVPADTERKRLFLVEDDGHLAQVLPLALRRHGYAVQTFAQADALVAALTEGDPSAIVLDVVLPAAARSAPEVVGRIRQTLRSPVPIVLLSPRRDLAARLELLRAKADVHFANPVDVDGLVRRLEALTSPATKEAGRVLIVVDDFGLALRYSLNLENAGLVTEAIADPVETLALVKDFGPDAILVDLSAAPCTGSELATLLRQEDDDLDVPIVIVSQDAGPAPAAVGLDLVVSRLADDESIAAAVAARARRHRIRRLATLREEAAETTAAEPETGATHLAYAKQTRRLQAIELELRKARDQQRQMLPEVPDLPDYRFRVLYEPCSEISGDFYDFIDLGEGRIGIAIGDVTGHGVTAALLMTMAKKVLHLVARTAQSPAEAIIRANREICGEVDKMTFVTLFYAVLDSRAGHLRYARAGHEPLVLFNPDRPNALQSLRPGGIALGLQAGRAFESALQEESLALAPGDLFFLYTDGLVEATDDDGNEFGRDRLDETFLSRPQWVPDALVEHLYGKVTSLSPGSPLADDLTLLAFRYR